MQKIKALFYKEFLSEYRNRSSFFGILLYAIAMVYICYLAFIDYIDPHAWVALFWILLLFASITSVSKSFLSESEGVQLLNYILFNPVQVILIKSCYNFLLLSFMAFITLLVYVLLLGNPLGNLLMFSLACLLGIASISSILTLMSAISSKAGGSSTLMAILSLPLLFPVLISVIKLSKVALDGLSWSVASNYILVLFALPMISITMAYILFPYLWRE
ncbi:MAG TPA: heme exporter protein CcmB [Bacteroidia bacterium]|nr:heme exporter protein CcmB [Bacteroidia bacterium]